MVTNVDVVNVIVATLVATVAVSPLPRLMVDAVPWPTLAFCIVNELAVLTAYPPTKILVAVMMPPTNIPPAIPNPPAICNTPVLVLYTPVVAVITNLLIVAVFAVRLPMLLMSPPVMSMSLPPAPAIYNVPPTYKSLPTARPPATCTAPVVVFVALAVPGTMIFVAVNVVPL